MYISIYLKFIKILKKLENKNYLALPMLLLEGGQGLYHHENPSQHMETAPALAMPLPPKVEVIIIYTLH